MRSPSLPDSLQYPSERRLVLYAMNRRFRRAELRKQPGDGGSHIGYYPAPYGARLADNVPTRGTAE